MRIALLALLTTASLSAAPVAEEFTAVALSTGGPLTNPVAAQLEITIERWSTADERQQFVDALAKGQDILLETLRELPSVGTIRTPGQLGWDLHYAHERPGEDGGRQIFLATDRPIGFWEAANQPRTIEYPFTFIELRLNAHGGGEGKLALATRVISSGGGRYVHLEHYDTEPVALTQVKRRG